MTDTTSRTIEKLESDETPLAKTDLCEEAKAMSEGLGGCVLGLMMGVPKDEVVPLGRKLMDQIVDGVGARDPLERMLVEQLAWTYHRVQSLSLLATTADDADQRLTAHQQCDKTMNAYRRGMLALKEYRGVRQRSPYVAIQQVNEAAPGDVVVSTSGAGRKKLANGMEAEHGVSTTDRRESGQP